MEKNLSRIAKGISRENPGHIPGGTLGEIFFRTLAEVSECLPGISAARVQVS